MIYLSLIMLGVIQGLAEFLPISSSGHLAIFKNLLPGLEAYTEDITLDILLHLGTLIAVFIVYRQTIWKMITGFFSMIAGISKGTFRLRKASRYQLMCLYVLLASVPLIIAAALKDLIASITSLLVVGLMLLLTAGLLVIADLSVKGDKDILKMKPAHAFKIGLFQLFATLPGVSRSGSTIAAAVNMGFTRETAVEFSFILGIPAVIGANVLNIGDVIAKGVSNNMIIPYLLATAAAAVSGILAIKLVKYVTNKDKFGWFAIYCAAAGVFAIILSFIR